MSPHASHGFVKSTIILFESRTLKINRYGETYFWVMGGLPKYGTIILEKGSYKKGDDAPSGTHPD
jgi:hypothetical protein